jgi:hypothetical protein
MALQHSDWFNNFFVFQGNVKATAFVTADLNLPTAVKGKEGFETSSALLLLSNVYTTMTTMLALLLPCRSISCFG